MVARTKFQAKGNRHELAVALRLSDEGGSVGWPFGEGAAWDLLSDFNGKVNRIQVKGSDVVKPNGTVEVNLTKGARRASPYSKEDCDYIVAVAGTVGMYVIPVEDVKHGRLFTWTGGRHKGQLPKYDSYKEAWHLLK